MERQRVYVTGLGIVSGIGNDSRSVSESVRFLRHGFSPFPVYPPFSDGDPGVVKWVASPKGFDVDSADFEDWTYPSEYAVRRDVLRGFSPHGLYVYCAMEQAIADAGLKGEEISNSDTGIYTSSGGSPRMIYNNLVRMKQLGPMRCSPTGIVSSISGTLSFNLVANYKIQGNSCGFSSACASSGHALGFAYDDIAMGRQARMFVAAGEDVNHESVVPFTGMRALSLVSDPRKASCPFDQRRSGFVCSGGGAVLVLESEAEATRRGSAPYAELVGWGQSSDGYNVAISHPGGEGLIRSMSNALRSTGVDASEVDYINAHATSTLIGDASEGKALDAVFSSHGLRPKVSSTKAITGHGLSLASALEAAIVSLAMKEGYTPGSAHIQHLDPQFESLDIIRETEPSAPKMAMSNSCGFGGANVSLIFRKV